MIGLQCSITNLLMRLFFLTLSLIGVINGTMSILTNQQVVINGLRLKMWLIICTKVWSVHQKVQKSSMGQHSYTFVVSMISIDWSHFIQNLESVRLDNGPQYKVENNA